MKTPESKEPQIECASCRKHFVWDEAYHCSETPGPVPNPPFHSNWLPRVFCPHCGALVVQWHVTQEKDFDEWLWVGDNAELNTKSPLPRSPIELWGVDIPQQFLPDYGEDRLEIEKIKFFFLEALKSENENVREEAAWTLSKIKDPRAVEPLVQVLKDKNKEIRLLATKALGEIGDARAEDALQEALKDEDEDVQKEAKEALEKIG